MKAEDAKVGMRVRTVEKCNGVPASSSGTIDHIHEDGSGCRVLIDGNPRWVPYYYRELEPADLPTQFQVGDEVELIEDWGGLVAKSEHGKITEFGSFTSGYQMVWIMFSCGKLTTVGTSCLRLVTPAEQAHAQTYDKRDWQRIYGSIAQEDTFDLRGVNRPTLCHVCHEIHDSRQQVEDCFNRAYSALEPEPQPEPTHMVKEKLNDIKLQLTGPEIGHESVWED